MAKVTVGLLHPGEMGSAVGEILRAGGAHVLWASEGRSQASRARAETAGLVDSRTLAALVGPSRVILSVAQTTCASTSKGPRSVWTRTWSSAWGGRGSASSTQAPAPLRSQVQPPPGLLGAEIFCV